VSAALGFLYPPVNGFARILFKARHAAQAADDGEFALGGQGAMLRIAALSMA
ncbi:hypothetical protein NEILACOT_05735, partial [Neisseria lactamica ATCC 23970]